MKIQTEFKLADGTVRSVYATNSGYQFAEVDILERGDRTIATLRLTMESNKEISFDHIFKYAVDWRSVEILDRAEKRANEELRWSLLEKRVKRALTFFTRPQRQRP